METRPRSEINPPAGSGRAVIAAARQFGVDEGSIEHIYLEHVLLLRRIASRKFGIPDDDAKTLVHDVFLCFIGNPKAVRTNVRAYLIAAICNASRNYWRSKNIEKRVFSDDDVAALEDSPRIVAEDFSEGLALHMTIGATLARLPLRQREVLRRRYLCDEDSKTIAAALNTTPENVDYIMHIGKRRALVEYKDITQVR